MNGVASSILSTAPLILSPSSPIPGTFRDLMIALTELGFSPGISQILRRGFGGHEIRKNEGVANRHDRS
jgi:hypothetical protein